MLQKRGDMLLSINRLLNLNGLVFIVLPLLCIDNSRCLDQDKLSDMSRVLGYQINLFLILLIIKIVKLYKD